jgi:hypothetical protein
MNKMNVRCKIDVSDHNAEILVTDCECLHSEIFSKNNEYLSHLGLTNMQFVNLISSIFFLRVFNKIL